MYLPCCPAVTSPSPSCGLQHHATLGLWFSTDAEHPSWIGDTASSSTVCSLDASHRGADRTQACAAVSRKEKSWSVSLFCLQHQLHNDVSCAVLPLQDHYQQSGLEGFVEDKIKALEKEIEQCFAQLEQPLNEGVKQAKLSHQKAFSQLLTVSSKL